MGPLHVLIEPDGFSLGSPGIVWVLLMFSRCLLGSLHVLYVPLSLQKHACEENLEL